MDNLLNYRTNVSNIVTGKRKFIGTKTNSIQTTHLHKTCQFHVVWNDGSESASSTLERIALLIMPQLTFDYDTKEIQGSELYVDDNEFKFKAAVTQNSPSVTISEITVIPPDNKRAVKLYIAQPGTEQLGIIAKVHNGVIQLNDTVTIWLFPAQVSQ